ncbi:MAG: argininosuccinate lyase [Lachnospiraceae bacterium]|nr:argininosuccinate lyase [Lachnospiraceae bacterium]
MEKLWGGRFEGALDSAAAAFQDSIGFDRRLYREDIRGSIAHAGMLSKCGIITEEEGETLIRALSELLKDMDEDRISPDDSFEDIHSFVESTLVDRIGETGKKLHTGRSRNDQVALDVRMYVRHRAAVMDRALFELEQTYGKIIRENKDTAMPGFTHMQKAQPVTLSHHVAAYFEMIRRDRSRIRDIYERLNECPLGAGALAGTTYPLDREMTARELGFYRPTANSMDSVSDRDYVIEYISALSIVMTHLSRSCEEIITWNSNEYGFVTVSDSFSTGSSIMPQKKNPDIAELVRGKTGRVYGDLISMLTVMKGIPLAYDKDMQEDKETLFDADDTAYACVRMYTGMFGTLTFNRERMRKSCENGFTNATDAADYLVVKGMPFRDAHRVIGEIVRYCIEKGKALSDLSMDEWKGFSGLFSEDIYDSVSIETCISRRNTCGAPGVSAMDEFIKGMDAYLDEGCICEPDIYGGKTDG